MKRLTRTVAVGVGLAFGLHLGLAQQRAAPPDLQSSERGQLLYDTHCVRCHAAQIHWRDLRSATDWDTLRAQVDRWQQQSRLEWPAEDIDAVARYLNETIYHYPEPKQRG